MRVAAGRGAGDVYEYVGSTPLAVGTDLSTQNYSDATKWTLVGRASGAQAFVLDSTIGGTTTGSASGALTADAIANQTIDAIVLAGSVAIAGGAGAVAVAGAGAAAMNSIAAVVGAYVNGSTGIKAASISLHATDTSAIHAITGAASIAASFGAVGVSVAIGVALASNTIANDIEAYIANGNVVAATGSGGIGLFAVEGATIESLTAAASISAAFGETGIAVSGAGALASNTILTHTNAFIDSSDVTSGGAVTISASDTATIQAIIAAASVAVAAGGVGASGSIGIALARNLIGYSLDAAPSHDYTSDQTISGLANGKRVKVVDGSGPRSGDVYEYVGTTIPTSTSVDLSKEDYGDPTSWRLVGLSDAAEQVQAYIHNSHVDATGALMLTATGSQTIDALVLAGSVAIAVGGTGVALTGAGSGAMNKVQVQVHAYIDGDTATGLTHERDQRDEHQRDRARHVDDHGPDRRRVRRCGHRRRRREPLDRRRRLLQRGGERRRGLHRQREERRHGDDGRDRARGADARPLARLLGEPDAGAARRRGGQRHRLSPRPRSGARSRRTASRCRRTSS